MPLALASRGGVWWSHPAYLSRRLKRRLLALVHTRDSVLVTHQNSVHKNGELDAQQAVVRPNKGNMQAVVHKRPAPLRAVVTAHAVTSTASHSLILRF